MTYQTRFSFIESKSVAAKQRTEKADASLTDLEKAISFLDCEISMTRIPDLADIDSDEDLASFNIFSPELDSDPAPRPKPQTRAARSRQARGRVVALRRRAIRSQLKRPLPQWPLPGGQADDDLRNMRDQIYTMNPADDAGKASVPLRLATHAISLSLMATALPIGAAMMTYNCLKGEDMRVTARMTTLTGLALVVLAGNPHLAQLIGA